MDVEEIVARAIATANGWSLPNDLTLPYAEGGRVGQTIAAARAALRALEEAGFRVVPVEPTFEMCRAAKWSLEKAKERDCKLQHERPYTAEEKHAIRWRAMLDAAGREEGATPAGSPAAPPT